MKNETNMISLQDIKLNIGNSLRIEKDDIQEMNEDKIHEISYVKLHEHIVNSHPINIENGDI